MFFKVVIVIELKIVNKIAVNHTHCILDKNSEQQMEIEWMFGGWVTSPKSIQAIFDEFTKFTQKMSHPPIDAKYIHEKKQL